MLRTFYYCEGKPLTSGEVEALGLGRTGVLALKGWSKKDVNTFEAALTPYKSNIAKLDFQKMHATRLPHKTPTELSAFWHNVWLAQKIEAAQDWFLENPQVSTLKQMTIFAHEKSVVQRHN